MNSSLAYKALKGVFCVYKPSGKSTGRVKFDLINKLGAGKLIKYVTTYLITTFNYECNPISSYIEITAATRIT